MTPEQQKLTDERDQLNLDIAEVGRQIIAQFGKIPDSEMEALHEKEQTMKRRSKELTAQIGAFQ